MSHDPEFDALVAKVGQIGPFQSSDPAEAAEAVAAALDAWNVNLRLAPEVLSQALLREEDRQILHKQIEQMSAGLNWVAQEFARLRLTGQFDPRHDNLTNRDE